MKDSTKYAYPATGYKGSPEKKLEIIKRQKELTIRES
jgi:hypothetical protein